MSVNSWEELQTQVIARAAVDESFRAGVVNDPRAAIATELGVSLPADLDIQVHEETATTMHLVLPATGKLDEVSLGSAAGGSGPGGGVYPEFNPAESPRFQG